MNRQEAQAIAELEMFYRLSVDEGVLLLSQLHERDREDKGVGKVVRRKQESGPDIWADSVDGGPQERWLAVLDSGFERTEADQARGHYQGDAR